MLILRMGLDKGKTQEKTNCLSLRNIGHFYLKNNVKLTVTALRLL